MRNTSAPGYVANFSASYYNGYLWLLHKNESETFTRTSGVRSDITHVSSDPSKWREPTPYQAMFLDADNILVDYESFELGGQIRRVSVGKINQHMSGPNLSVNESDLIGILPTQSDVDRSVIIARNNVADRAASFGESIMEARKTIASLGQMAGSIDNFLIHASQRKWAKAAKALGLERGDKRTSKAIKRLERTTSPAADAWLAFNFGLAPIVSDMVSAAILLGGEWDFRVTGKTVLITSRSNNQYTGNGSIAWIGASVHYDLFETIEAGVHTRLDFTLTNKYLQGFTKFGLTDGLATAYALVPYTFLLDFVLPVSTVLKSLTATQGLTFRGGTSTVFAKKQLKARNGTITAPPSYNVTRKIVSDATVTGKKMDRRKYENEPNPVTLWVQDPLDAFKVSTVLAVLAQRMFKLFPK